MTTITIAEFLADISSLKACEPSSALALTSLSTRHLTAQSSPEIQPALEFINTYKEIKQKKTDVSGVDGELERMRRRVEEVERRIS